MLFKFECELINYTNTAANVGPVFQGELQSVIYKVRMQFYQLLGRTHVCLAVVDLCGIMSV